MTEKSSFLVNGERWPETGPAGCAQDNPDIAGLLAAMRAGDREAAATFVTRYGPRLRRRVRGKLSRAMRRVLDSQDILSTVGRRLDAYVCSGNLEARSVGELWSLVTTIAERVLIDRATEVRRQGIAHREMPVKSAVRTGDQPAPPLLPIDRAMETVTDEKNRQILSLWLNGTSHGLIAARLGLSPSAVRQRWHRMMSDLRRRFGSSPRSQR